MNHPADQPNSLPAPAAFPPPRVPPRPLPALLGIWYLNTRHFFTLRHWLTVAGMLIVLVVLSIPATETVAIARDELPAWAAGFYVCFIVPLLSFTNAAGALREDLTGASVDYVLTRPVRRPQFIVFRYLTQMVAAQISFLFGFATVLGLCVFWDVPNLAAAVPVLLLGQVCAVMTFSAVGFFCAAITSRYIIVGLLYGAIVEIGLGSVPTQLSQISLVRHVLALQQSLLGDSGWAVSKQVGTSADPVLTLFVLLGVTATAIALTATLFSIREFAGSGAREA
jgi:ABC-2 type transport system permease protein